MYYEHFGLTQAPFKITPNTEFFFSGGNRGPVLEALIYAITRGEGIVKVTGEVGSGKTMLCNMLQSRLPDNVESVYLSNPSVAPEEVLHAIAFELQLGVERKADRLQVMHALQDYLVKRHAEGKRVVVFIEESQSMPLPTLEEIRLLSNLETRTDKLLQIVLFGQPELDENLRRPDIRQLRDRIAHSFRLQPLTHEEVREYLMFRMRAAGYRGPDIFAPAVVKKIAESSSGLTRRINLIADKALLAAFSENTHTIEARHVRAALRDSEFGYEAASWRFRPAWGWAALMLVAGVGIGAGVHAYVGSRIDSAPPSAPAPVPTTQAPPPVQASSVPDPDPSLGKTATPSAPPVNVMQASADTSASRTVADAPVSAAPAPAPAPVRAADGDVVAARMAATQEWITSAPADAYSVQLFVADNEQQLRNHLKAGLKSIETNELYMYRSSANGRPIVNVLWGSFADRQAAQQMIAELPGSLRTSRPYVRTLSGIRAEAERQRK